MAFQFWDTSSMAKRYAAETGTTWVRQQIDPASGNSAFIARITTVELISAMTRRERGRSSTAEEGAEYRQHIRISLPRETRIVELTEPIANWAMDLAERYVLRGYDAVQLATACELNAMIAQAELGNITFVCADNALLDAARQEGLQTENPNDYP